MDKLNSFLGVISTDHHLGLDVLLAKQAALLILTADGCKQQHSGFIASAQRMGSDDGLVCYRLSLRFWNWLQYARHSFVFQGSYVRQIVDAAV